MLLGMTLDAFDLQFLLILEMLLRLKRDILAIY